MTDLDGAVMCADGCSGCSAACAACASGCADCAGCDSARLATENESIRDGAKMANSTHSARAASAVVLLAGLDMLAYDPGQKRSRHTGQWTEGGGNPSIPRASEGGGMGAGGGGRQRADRRNLPGPMPEQMEMEEEEEEDPPVAVEAVLDDLTEGKITMAEAVRDFGSRPWTSAKAWAIVQNDPRLTAEQYQMFGAAYRRAVGR